MVRVGIEPSMISLFSSTTEKKVNEEVAQGQNDYEGADGHGNYMSRVELYCCGVPR
jgi:hypothetical protein